ncbi:MAG TPA: hypothetical protein VFT98_16165 [Myxococcota bacterium]|nr:hypothetical protein [Myxococcota bacterium]
MSAKPLRELYEKATPGSWRVGNLPTLEGLRDLVRTFIVSGDVAVISKYAKPADLALIVRLREIAPLLIEWEQSIVKTGHLGSRARALLAAIRGES